MILPLPRHRLAALAVLALALAACTAAPDAQAPEAPVVESSVRPGANTRFLAEDLDVDQFVDMFESESREIAAEREALTAALQVEPGMAVADIGAGTGLFLEPFAEAVGPSGKLYAVDISPGFTAHLEQRIAAEDLTWVEARLCSERSSELPPASVDRIFICDTYHHFEFPHSTMASLAAALRPGGQLIVVDFEREPGVSSDWVLEHVRAGKTTVIDEIEAVGFQLVDEVPVDGLTENYVLRFRLP